MGFLNLIFNKASNKFLNKLLTTEDYRREFIFELGKINYKRAHFFSFVLAILDIAFIFVDSQNMINGLWTKVPGYIYLFYLHLIILAYMLLFIFLSLATKYYKFNIYNILNYSFAIFILLISTSVSIVDQSIHSEITVYILGCFGVAVGFYFKPVASFILYITSYSYFLLGISFFQDNPDILKGHYINGSLLVALSWFVSLIIYNLRLKDFLNRKTIEKQKSELEDAIVEITVSNQNLQESLNALDESKNIILTLALALESKDNYTKGHSERVSNYALRLARHINLPEIEITNLERAAILHDIGKIGIPDSILNKDGQLTNEEWIIMRSHPERGQNICSKLKFTQDILPVIRHHHEKYNGLGYPDGLKDEEIPFLARIIGIADAFDAMTSHRPYRPPLSLEQSLLELEKGAGIHFDPNLVKEFINLYKKDTVI